ncbi:Methanogenesis regulatory histidine kinase FilI [uncultured archaeon]|nr:Methanogenesis regulatory histidine kinase FilI [uncultured archaeon]
MDGMKSSDLHSKITDLKLRIDDLMKNTMDPKDALAAAMKELSNALEEIDIAQKEPLPQDKNLQSSHLAVEAERQRYLKLFNLMPCGCIITDLKGTIKEANNAASNLLRSKIIGVSLATLLEEGNLDDLKTNLDRLKRGEVIRDWEVRMKPPEGMVIPVSISANGIPDSQDKPSSLSWLIHDMTEYRRAEEALRESEAMYRQIIENANEVIVVAQERILKFANRKAVEVTGYSKRELESMQFTELIHPDDRQMVMENYLRRLKGESVPAAYSFRVINKRGDIRWARISPVKIFWGGRPATLNLMSDITEGRQAEEELRLFKSAVANANDGVVILMPDPADMKRPRIEYTNQAFQKMTGYDREEMIGRCPEFLSGPDTDPAPIAEIKKALSNKQPTRVERISYRKDKTKFWSELSLVPLLNKAGEVDHWVSIERETTERRRYEEELKEAKRVLHENLSFLQRLADTIPSPVFYTGLNGRYLGCNKVFEGLLGIGREEIIGRSAYKLMPKDMADRYHEMDESLFSSPGTQVYEAQVQNAKGIILDFVITKATYTDADGAMAGIVGVMLDITERKRAEETLRTERLKLDMVLQNIGAGLAIISRDYRTVWANNVLKKIFGDVEGKSCHLTYNQQDTVCPDCGVKRVFEQGEEVAVHEQSGKDAQGETIWSQIIATPIRDDKGKVTEALELVVPITERKRSEEALAFNNIILRTQQELSLDGVLVVDEHGEILSSNQRFVDMWEISPDVIESRSDERALLSVMDKLANPEEFMRKVKQLHEVRDETSRDEIVLKDGRSFDCYSAPMLGASGRYYGRVLYFRDITERKQADEVRERLVRELESKNIEMERFIYTVSHDLRSPLLTINGFVGFLESDLAKGSSERVKVDLKMISSAISKMDRLLKDTLELSRIGRVANPPEVVSFTEIVQEALDQMSEKIRARGVQVKIKTNLPFVNVDRMRIVEVLINLMENSIKYMGDQPHPNIEVGCRLDGGEKVFFVKDNGMGIDPSQHDKVFGLFYKVDKKSEGSGAGLAIVKRIIEIHGGRIWVESELGKGCTICFNLPVAK